MARVCWQGNVPPNHQPLTRLPLPTPSLPPSPYPTTTPQLSRSVPLNTSIPQYLNTAPPGSVCICLIIFFHDIQHLAPSRPPSSPSFLFLVLSPRSRPLAPLRVSSPPHAHANAHSRRRTRSRARTHVHIIGHHHVQDAHRLRPASRPGRGAVRDTRSIALSVVLSLSLCLPSLFLTHSLTLSCFPFISMYPFLPPSLSLFLPPEFIYQFPSPTSTRTRTPARGSRAAPFGSRGSTMTKRRSRSTVETRSGVTSMTIFTYIYIYIYIYIYNIIYIYIYIISNIHVYKYMNVYMYAYLYLRIYIIYLLTYIYYI